MIWYKVVTELTTFFIMARGNGIGPLQSLSLQGSRRQHFIKRFLRKKKLDNRQLVSYFY